MRTDCAVSSACVADAEAVAKAAEDIATMVKSKSVDFGKLLTDVTTIANDVRSAETDCSVSVADKIHFEGNINSCITDVEGVAAAAMDIAS